MSGFLDYLDEFDNRKDRVVKEESRQVESSSKRKSKVLCLNVEVRSPEGADVVIEKLQSWVSENFGESEKPKPKTQYRISSKKINKNPIVETRSHATNILDGLPDEHDIKEQNHDNINNIAHQQSHFKLDSVKGHASALL